MPCLCEPFNDVGWFVLAEGFMLKIGGVITLAKVRVALPAAAWSIAELIKIDPSIRCGSGEPNRVRKE